ncbi:MAG TPA: nicotinate-nucleotide adenylyltransferase [Parachlamydiaceae bacterium]|nr:nicotinate-nucleotide adenylyltransferase [Parachlamydiaceae bacterium]
MKKIGFFGGSFDPIHFGHLNLALEIKEAKNLDEVIFCPAYINPNKEPNDKGASIEERFQMVKFAIEGIDYFKASDIEAKREGISYTVDTLETLAKENKEAQIFLILGLDAAANFSSWKDPEKILSLATPLIGLRDFSSLDQNLKYYPVFKKGLVKTHLLDISSTEIRRRLQLKLYIRHLVPSKVVDYIYEHHLY